MTFTPATWLLVIIPMPGIILLSAVYYVSFLKRSKAKTSTN
jgi:hypothetical protein